VIVVLRALKLGDLLTAVPALRALRRAFPEERLVLAAPAGLAPLALHTGSVDRVVDTAPLAPLDASLGGAALAVNLHGRGPQSTARLAETGPGRLVAFDLPGQPIWRAAEHERARWCRLLSESGIPADPADLCVAPPDLDPPTAAVGATVLHPGAASGARRWPVERWAELARHLVDQGDRLVITGDPSERSLAEDLARRARLDGACVLAGRTTLLDLLAVVAAARRVVCGDTGMAHLASALATPSLVLFGPTPPSAWGPPTSGPHLALWRGATGDPHAGEPFPGLLAISVAEVIEGLGHLVERS
jgi:ADP-heptose:LPS heptosyltransferase